MLRHKEYKVIISHDTQAISVALSGGFMKYS